MRHSSIQVCGTLLIHKSLWWFFHHLYICLYKISDVERHLPPLHIFYLNLFSFNFSLNIPVQILKFAPLPTYLSSAPARINHVHAQTDCTSYIMLVQTTMHITLHTMFTYEHIRYPINSFF